MNRQRSTRLLPAILLLAILLRLAALSMTGIDTLTFGDAADYLDTARFVCQYSDYPQRGNLPFFRAPLFPLLLALITGCNPAPGLLAGLLGPLLDVGTVAVLFFLAWRLTQDTTVATVTAFLAAVYPVFVYQSLDLRSEPLFMLLVVLTLLCFVSRRLLLTGIFLGLAALARPTALALLPFFAAAIGLNAYALDRDQGWGTKLRSTASLATAFLLTLAPWIAFNLHKHGEWILINDAAGYNFWRGSHPEMYRLMHLDADKDFAAAAARFEAETTAVQARQVEAQASTPLARSRLWFHLGVENITDDPAAYLRFTLWKLTAYWRPWLKPALHTPAAVVASALCFVPLYLFGIAGLARTWQQDRKLVGLVLLFFLWTWLVQVPFQIVMRFRIPFVDPLMITFAAIRVVAWGRTTLGASRVQPGATSR